MEGFNNAGALDGYIALIDDKGVRIVVEGFSGTTEIRFFDADEDWLSLLKDAS